VSKLKAIIDSGRKAGIEAYHGSPYDFPAERELQFDDPRDVPIFDQDISIFDGRAYQPIDAPVPEGARVVQEFPLGRFDSSKIGTGEGAQAYGRGSYLAESEDLARGYRDQLKGNVVIRDDGVKLPYAKHVSEIETAIKNKFPKLAPDNVRMTAKSVVNDNLVPADVEGMGVFDSTGYKAEDIYLEGIRANKGARASKGSMYKVNIDADPDELIDWDELIDEQPKKVMDKLQSADWWPYAEEGIYDIAGARGENPTGADLVRWLEQDGQEYAAEALEDLGVKGIKYADAFTRHKPKDKRSNNYVIFDPRIIEISKKYGISIPLASAVIAGTVTPEEAQAVGFGSVVKKSLSDKTDEIQQGIGSLPAGDEMVTGGDLQFLMNIRPGSLRAQQDMGAFPMPSLAVVRQDQPFDSFGEITLVGDPASFDPKRLKANVVFNADAYTVRAPRPFRIAQKDAGLQFKNRFEPVAKEFQEGRVSDLTYELGEMELKKRATAQGFADVQRFFESDLIADVVFLREKGITDIPTTEGAGGNIFLERASLQDLIKPYADERRAWGRKELDKLFKEEEFFDASTNRDYYTGKGLKLKPYTAEEVLKFMKKSRGSAQEGGMATPGALRASLTEKLSSLKDIRAQSGKLVGSDKFKDFQNSSYERISDLAESLRPFYKFDSSSFGYSNEVIEMLIESQKRGLDRTLSEFGFEDVPDYALQEIQEVKSYFRNAPTEYFEAKPERLVDIEEFEGAIVPEGTSDDIIQALKDSGIKIETYADDAQRLNARKKFGGTAFSVAGGITLVGLVPPEESYAAGPSSFIKMNKVVEDQRIKQAKDAGFDTDTVYYHGSDSDIEEFRMPSRDTGQTKTVGTGVFMSSSPDVASSYAKSIDGAAVYPVYINKKEFLKIRPELEGNSWASISTDGLVVEFPDGSTKPATEVFDLDSASTDTDELSRLARSQGHKGLIIEGIVDTGYGGAGEYRYATKYLQEKGYDVSLPIGSTKEAYDKISAVPSEVMNAARLYAQEKLLSPADVVVSFEPKNIRSINAEFDPEKKDSPQILASAPFAAGVAGLGAASLLAPDQAEAGGLGSLPAATKKARAESVKQAKEQGYDLNNVMYHASKQDIKEFVPGYSDGLVFLTPSKEFANNWLGKGKFQERQGGTGAIEGVRAEKKRWREEADKILKSLPEDQRQQYYEEILNPQRQQLLKDERLADSAIYPVVTRTKKPFVPSKNVDVLEELYSKEYLDAPFGSGFPTYRDALKDGNYLLYEKKEVVDFLKSKGYDSMFLKESSGADEPFTTLAVFEPNNIRSVNAKFDPEKKDSPQILASAPFAAGAAGLGATAVLSSEDAEAGGMGVRSRRMPDDVAFKAAPKKESPGLPSLVGQLGLGAMSEIAGTILGGAAGVDEYLRGSPTESIRDAREGTSEFVGGLYDAGPEAQQLGQEAVKGIAGIVGPTIDYAMEGPVMDERGLNVLPLIAKALNMSYEGWKEIYDLLPEREQEAVISAADAFL
jgi:hypothetical protein